MGVIDHMSVHSGIAPGLFLSLDSGYLGVYIRFPLQWEVIAVRHPWSQTLLSGIDIARLIYSYLFVDIETEI